MAIQLIITSEGKAAIAQVAQVGPVKITTIAIGSSGYTPNVSQTSLLSEIKRLEAKGSTATGSSVIHVTAQDNSPDSYHIKEIGLLTSDGILFAVYSQSDDILIKGSGSVALLAFDFAITNVPAESIVLDKAEFDYPPATETTEGVAKIATQEEVNTGKDDKTFVTPFKLTNALKRTVQIASEVDVISGKDDAVFVTPAKVKMVADSIVGIRNRLINGTMTVDQRFEGKMTAIQSSLEYCIDRWLASATGALARGQRIPMPNGGYAYRFSGAEGNTGINFLQRIEAVNCLDLGNTNCQLSFVAYSSSIRSLKWAINVADKPDIWTSNALTIANGEIAIDQNPKRYNININTTFRAINGICILFATPALPAGQTIHFSDVQFEKGAISTPFEYRPIGLEMLLCQRYYEIVDCYFDAHVANFASDLWFRQAWHFSVQKRITEWTNRFQTIPGANPAAPSPGGIISSRSAKHFVTAIQFNTNNEFAWRIIADAEL